MKALLTFLLILLPFLAPAQTTTTRAVTVNTNDILVGQSTNLFWANSNLLNASVRANLATGFVSIAQFNYGSNVLLYTTFLYGTNLTNFGNALALSGTNNVFAQGVKSTNFALSLALASSNYTALFGTNATNHTHLMVNTLGTNATNYVNLMSNILVTFRIGGLGTNVTNYVAGMSNALYQFDTNYFAYKTNPVFQGVINSTNLSALSNILWAQASAGFATNVLVYNYALGQFGIQSGTNVFLTNGVALTNPAIAGIIASTNLASISNILWALSDANLTALNSVSNKYKTNYINGLLAGNNITFGTNGTNLTVAGVSYNVDQFVLNGTNVYVKSNAWFTNSSIWTLSLRERDDTGKGITMSNSGNFFYISDFGNANTNWLQFRGQAGSPSILWNVATNTFYGYIVSTNLDFRLTASNQVTLLLSSNYTDGTSNNLSKIKADKTNSVLRWENSSGPITLFADGGEIWGATNSQLGSMIMYYNGDLGVFFFPEDITVQGYADSTKAFRGNGYILTNLLTFQSNAAAITTNWKTLNAVGLSFTTNSGSSISLGFSAFSNSIYQASGAGSSNYTLSLALTSSNYSGTFATAFRSNGTTIVTNITALNFVGLTTITNAAGVISVSFPSGGGSGNYIANTNGNAYGTLTAYGPVMHLDGAVFNYTELVGESAYTNFEESAMAILTPFSGYSVFSWAMSDTDFGDPQTRTNVIATMSTDYEHNLIFATAPAYPGEGSIRKQIMFRPNSALGSTTSDAAVIFDGAYIESRVPYVGNGYRLTNLVTILSNGNVITTNMVGVNLVGMPFLTNLLGTNSLGFSAFSNSIYTASINTAGTAATNANNSLGTALTNYALALALNGTNNVAGLRTAFVTVSNDFKSVSNAFIIVSNNLNTALANTNWVRVTNGIAYGYTNRARAVLQYDSFGEYNLTYPTNMILYLDGTDGHDQGLFGFGFSNLVQGGLKFDTSANFDWISQSGMRFWSGPLDFSGTIAFSFDTSGRVLFNRHIEFSDLFDFELPQPTGPDVYLYAGQMYANNAGGTPFVISRDPSIFIRSNGVEIASVTNIDFVGVPTMTNTDGTLTISFPSGSGSTSFDSSSGSRFYTNGSSQIAWTGTNMVGKFWTNFGDYVGSWSVGASNLMASNGVYGKLAQFTNTVTAGILTANTNIYGVAATFTNSETAGIVTAKTNFYGQDMLLTNDLTVGRNVLATGSVTGAGLFSPSANKIGWTGNTLMQSINNGEMSVLYNSLQSNSVLYFAKPIYNAADSNPYVPSPTQSGSYQHNQGSSINLFAELRPYNNDYTFVVTEPGKAMKIYGTNMTIRSGNSRTTNNGYIASSIVGSMVHMIRMNATNWYIDDISGVWTNDLGYNVGDGRYTEQTIVANTVYTNNGRGPQLLTVGVNLTAAAVNGDCSLDLMVDPAGGGSLVLKQRIATTTLLTGIAMSSTNNLIGVIPQGGTWCLTNTSVGAGNAAGIVSGLSQVTDLR